MVRLERPEELETLVLVPTLQDLTRQITKLHNEAGEAFLIPESLHECTTALREAQATVKVLVQEHDSRRRAEQEERIQQAQRGNGKTPVQILRNIRKAEEIKAVFKKLKFLKSGGTRMDEDSI
jgi:hypothetical protein